MPGHSPHRSLAYLPLLIEHFLNVLTNDSGELRISPEALDTLAAHSWPGNVRELENAMQRAVVLARDGEIRSEDFPRRVRGISTVSGEHIPAHAPNTRPDARPDARSLGSPAAQPPQPDGAHGVPSFASVLDTQNGLGAAPGAGNGAARRDAGGDADAAGPPDSVLPAVSLADLERLAIEEALVRCNGSLSAVGRELGIARTTLYRKLKKYGIET